MRIWIRFLSCMFPYIKSIIYYHYDIEEKLAYEFFSESYYQLKLFGHEFYSIAAYMLC